MVKKAPKPDKPGAPAAAAGESTANAGKPNNATTSDKDAAEAQRLALAAKAKSNNTVDADDVADANRKKKTSAQDALNSAKEARRKAGGKVVVADKPKPVHAPQPPLQTARYASRIADILPVDAEGKCLRAKTTSLQFAAARASSVSVPCTTTSAGGFARSSTTRP